ncbi:TadE/TadG family type IV pilus assembly protein [Solirhodobacter olei]|uniref:TadE/TadG family type IV pilus assembly protein n=1 Tax=Solirhodobacter olei TaxID=2493082 RepID=UPI000FD9188B|nr:hypothetical protein [Solirhodobacter olei]
MKAVFPKALRSFARDRSGSVSLEALIVLPILLWANLATFVYFDVFNKIFINEAATYTLADMISRQTQTVTPSYIQGMASLYDYLNGQTSPTAAAQTWVRVTCITYSSVSKEYSVVWSYGTNNQPALTTAMLQSTVKSLPVMSGGDTLIQVETQMHYVPKFNMGLTPRDLYQLVLTRPRIAPQVAFSSS